MPQSLLNAKAQEKQCVLGWQLIKAAKVSYLVDDLAT
jgi:hypothetical protein